MPEMDERINQFLFPEEHVQGGDVIQYVNQIAADTGVAADDVKKVLDAVLKILEQKRADKGIVDGEAFPAFVVRRHAGRRMLFGGRW